MDASRLLALGVVLCAATPSSAERPAHFDTPHVDAAPIGPALIELLGSHSVHAHPLPLHHEVRLPPTQAATEVHVCEAPGCDLYRTHVLHPSSGPVRLVLHPSSGPLWLGEHYVPGMAKSPTRTYAPHNAHVIALYGTFTEGALLSSTLQRGARDSGLQGGVSPVEASALLSEQPEQVLSFEGVVVAPDAEVGDELLASLRRLLEMGGVVAVPRSMAAGLGDLVSGTGTPLVADESARLVELGSGRVLAEGARPLDATAVFSRGGVIVVYGPLSLNESYLSDALLAAVPRFSMTPRLSYTDALDTPASRAAGIAVSRPAHSLLLALPLLVAMVLLFVAIRSRRRGDGLVTRSFVAIAFGSTVALIFVPRALHDDGAHADVRTYVSFGNTPWVFEEGAVATRPSTSGGVVTLTAPLGSLPRGELRGIDVPRPVPLEVLDDGRTLRFPVHGDGIGVAGWLRPVAVEALHVEYVDGAWPTGSADFMVQNQLPFALDVVQRVGPDGSTFAGPPLAPGQRTKAWSATEAWTDTSDVGNDPLLLAKAHLLEALRQRCRTWGGNATATACVVGIGTAPDGALVGVQVLSP